MFHLFLYKDLHEWGPLTLCHDSRTFPLTPFFLLLAKKILGKECIVSLFLTLTFYINLIYYSVFCCLLTFKETGRCIYTIVNFFKEINWNNFITGYHNIVIRLVYNVTWLDTLQLPFVRNQLQILRNHPKIC